MTKIKICKEKNCHNAQSTQGFCRLHYLKNWKKVQTEKRGKATKSLNRYVESILKRYPDRYMEQIKKDIRSKDFDEKVESKFGLEDEPIIVFDPNTTDEELTKILEGLKIEKGF